MSALALATLARAELAGLARRRWLGVAAAAGLAVILAVGALAARDSGLGRADALRAGGASLLLLGGLVVAVGLGAAALNRPADSGHLGLLAGAGTGRARLAGVMLVARVGALVGVIALWGLALQVASLALGRSLDGPFALHTLAMTENLLLALLGAAIVSSVVGPIASGIVGLGLYVAAQAVVNLQAAADQGLVGTAEGLVRVAYLVLPRTIVSEMIFLLQARDAAGPAAPSFEINAPRAGLAQTVFVPPSGTASVLWTLAWCAALAVVAAVGLRRRTLA